MVDYNNEVIVRTIKGKTGRVKQRDVWRIPVPYNIYIYIRSLICYFNLKPNKTILMV